MVHGAIQVAHDANSTCSLYVVRDEPIYSHLEGNDNSATGTHDAHTLRSMTGHPVPYRKKHEGWGMDGCGLCCAAILNEPHVSQVKKTIMIDTSYQTWCMKLTNSLSMHYRSNTWCHEARRSLRASARYDNEARAHQRCHQRGGKE